MFGGGHSRNQEESSYGRGAALSLGESLIGLGCRAFVIRELCDGWHIAGMGSVSILSCDLLGGIDAGPDHFCVVGVHCNGELNGGDDHAGARLPRAYSR
jgi:hypothetical protein